MLHRVFLRGAQFGGNGPVAIHRRQHVTKASITEEPRTGQLLVWRLLYLVLQGGSSLALVALTLRWAPADAASAFLVAQGTVVAVQTIADLGVSQGAATWLARARDEQPEIADELTASFMTAASYTAGAAVVASAASALLFIGDSDLMLTMVLCAPLAGLAVVVAALDGTLRAQNEIRTPVVIAAVSRLGMLVGAGVGALVAETAAEIAVACSAVTLAATLPGLVRLWRGRAGAEVWRRHRRTVVAACLPIAGSQTAVVLSARVTTPLVASIDGKIAASAFEVAWRLYQLVQYGLGGAMTAYFPRIAREQARGETTTLRLALLISIVGGSLCGAVIYLAAPYAGDLVSGTLAQPTVEALELLAFATPFGVMALPAGAALAASGRAGNRALLWISAAGAVVNLAFSATIAHTGLSAAAGPAAAAVLAGSLLGVAAWRLTGRQAHPLR